MRAKLSPKKREEIFARHDHKCVMCGAQGILELDHILPLALGGVDGPPNLAPLCVPCHRGKGAKTSKDIAKISKANRQKKKHLTGRSRARKGKPMKSRGFSSWLSMSGEVRKRSSNA